MNSKQAIVLFSGGQDSTTCLYWAKERFEKVVAISFSYGQKHSNEVAIARQLAAQAGVEFEVMDAHYISDLSINALTDTQMTMEEDHNCPNTFVPGRNLFFLSMVAVYAYEHNIQHLVTGVSQTDFSGYPDCRHNFIQSANLTLNLAMDREFVLHAPLMWLDKSEVWELSEQLGVFDLVRNETLTCYNGIKAEGCGHCPACKLRNQGLETYLERKKK